MAMDSGVQNQISLAIESTFGTAVTPTASVGIRESDGIQVRQEMVFAEEVRGTAPKNKASARGKRSYEGAFEMDAYPSMLGNFLVSVFGAPTTSTLESGVYKHTFKDGADATLTKKSLTVEQVVGAITKRFAGFVVGKFSLEAKAGELIMVSVEGMAKTQADATAITKTYESARPFNWSDVTTLSIAGTDIKAKCEEFSIEFDNGLEMFHGFSSTYEPTDKYIKQSELKGKMKLYVDSSTKQYLEDHMNGTEQEIIIELTGATIGTVNNNKLKFTMSKCVMSQIETPLGFEYNAIELEFEGREDSTNGLIKTELTNTTASY